jgi:flagellin
MSILRVNHNIAAMNTQRNLDVNSFNLSKSLQKLSSGFRINVAADGPADLIISEGLRGQMSGIKAALRNTQESSNLLSIAEGALNEVSNLLTTMRALAVHAANRGVVSQSQQNADQAELNRAVSSIVRIGLATRFAGDLVFTSASRRFQIGEGTGTGDSVNLVISLLTASKVGFTTALSINGSVAKAISALGKISAAIGTIATRRGVLGAFIKDTLQTNINSLSVSLENITATESYIRDTNMASETSEYTKNQILVQAGVSVLAQANVASQSVLALLR